MATIGAPVGTPGKGPEEPAMSTWLYLMGLSESLPCLSRPEAIMRKAEGAWCPRLVATDG